MLFFGSKQEYNMVHVISDPSLKLNDYAVIHMYFFLTMVNFSYNFRNISSNYYEIKSIFCVQNKGHVVLEHVVYLRIISIVISCTLYSCTKFCMSEP
jgi:hypothetical protein